MKKNELRTLDVVTYRNGEERTVYFNTPEGDVLKNKNLVATYLNQFYDDLTVRDWSNDFDIIKVTRDGETIWERKEKLPVGAAYIARNGCYAWFTSYNTGFGFNVRGDWFTFSDLNLKSDDPLFAWKPVPTEEWQLRLIEYAEKRGFVEGARFKSIGLGNEYVVTNGKLSVWEQEDINHGNIYPSNNSGCIFKSSTGEWAEIIQKDECDLSTERLIEIIKKRTGANHVQILIDRDGIDRTM